MVLSGSVLRRTARLVVTAAFAALLCNASPALAQGLLGYAEGFAVLGASTVASGGLTTINGEMGVSPGTAISGFPPGLMAGGAAHYGDTLALQAHSDAGLAYAALVNTACPPGSNVTGRDLGGLGTLYPGIYCFSSEAMLTGTLILDAGNNPNALFIFKIASTLRGSSANSTSPMSAPVLEPPTIDVDPAGG